MADAVVRIYLYVCIFLGENIIAQNAHPFTSAVHVRKRYKLVLCGKITNLLVRSLVFHPTPVSHENTYKRISRQFGIFAVVKLAAVLQPPFETQSVRLAIKALGERINPVGRLERHILFAHHHARQTVAAEQTSAHRRHIRHVRRAGFTILFNAFTPVHELCAGEVSDPTVTGGVGEELCTNSRAHAGERISSKHGGDLLARLLNGVNARIHEKRKILFRRGHLSEYAGKGKVVSFRRVRLGKNRLFDNAAFTIAEMPAGTVQQHAQFARDVAAENGTILNESHLKPMPSGGDRRRNAGRSAADNYKIKLSAIRDTGRHTGAKIALALQFPCFIRRRKRKIS